MTPTQRSLAALRELGYLVEIVLSVPNVCAECRIKSVQLSGQQQCACVHFSAHSYFKGKK